MNTNEKMKVFNYRPLVSLCLFFLAGVVFTVGLYSGNLFYLILSCLSVLLLVLTIIFKLIYAKSNKLFKVLSIIIAFILSAGLTVAHFEINNNNYNVGGEYYITGRVSSRTYTNTSGKIVVSIDNVKVVNLKTLEKDVINCDVRLYLAESDGRAFGFDLGENICATVSLTKADLFSKGEPNFYMYNHNVKVLGFGSEESVASLSKFNKNIFDKIKIKVKSILDTYLSEDYSELGLAMLFGDKTGLDDKMYSSYSASGIGHLLAVSGLHVGFIVTLLSLILSLFKANKKTRFYVITIMLFLYAFLCGFSVSVTRAFIMVAVLLYSKSREVEYDSLSALCFAGLILLLINPLNTFDVGFILSFSSVASIILFAKPMQLFFSKFLGEKLSSALSVSVAVTIGTTLPTAVYFSKISIFSVITNVIVIPIASVAYMLMFVFVILALIIPPLGVFIYLFEFLMSIVTIISGLTGAITFANVNNICLFIFGTLLIVSAMFASDYLLINKKKRIILTTSSSVVTLLALIAVFIC